jgi:hypothetical protein
MYKIFQVVSVKYSMRVLQYFACVYKSIINHLKLFFLIYSFTYPCLIYYDIYHRTFDPAVVLMQFLIFQILGSVLVLL